MAGEAEQWGRSGLERNEGKRTNKNEMCMKIKHETHYLLCLFLKTHKITVPVLKILSCSKHEFVRASVYN